MVIIKYSLPEKEFRFRETPVEQRMKVTKEGQIR